MTYKIAIASDMHVGSIYGIMPRRFCTEAGVEILPNKGQEYLLECFHHFTAQAIRLGVDAVVLNGDIIDGKQPKQERTETNMPSMIDQGDCARDILSVFLRRLKNPPTFYVKGTEYHEGIDGHDAESLARDLGCQKVKGVGTGTFAKESIDLDVDGVGVNFLHGISVSVGFYRATAIDREALWSAIAYKEGTVPHADFVVRSHCHFFVHLEYETKHGLITPANQLQTKHMRKNSRYRMMPSLGNLLLEIDPRAKRQGRDPFTIHKFMYPQPPVRATRVSL